MHLSTKAVVSLTKLSEERKDGLGILDVQFGMLSGMPLDIVLSFGIQWVTGRHTVASLLVFTVSNMKV